MTQARAPVLAASNLILRDGVWKRNQRAIAEETAIAFVVDGAAEAVMMASPSDLEDFAYGFALTEGLVASPADIRELEFVDAELGIEARLWLAEGARARHAQRRRRRAGPVGCGLCGIESLEQAMRSIAPIESEFCIDAEELLTAMAALAPLQSLYQQTRAVHAAAFYTSREGIVALREDAGRHNALDKLVGALARAGHDGRDGVVLMTSRVSIELIQKAAHIGAPVLAAISAPTALALRAAEAAGICVCAIVRDNGLEVFTRAKRILGHADAD
jgi:FdhD protein